MFDDKILRVMKIWLSMYFLNYLAKAQKIVLNALLNTHITTVRTNTFHSSTDSSQNLQESD